MMSLVNGVLACSRALRALGALHTHEKSYLEHNIVWESCFPKKCIYTWIKRSR